MGYSAQINQSIDLKKHFSVVQNFHFFAGYTICIHPSKINSQSLEGGCGRGGGQGGRKCGFYFS